MIFLLDVRGEVGEGNRHSAHCGACANHKKETAGLQGHVPDAFVFFPVQGCDVIRSRKSSGKANDRKTQKAVGFHIFSGEFDFPNPRQFDSEQHFVQRKCRDNGGRIRRFADENIFIAAVG
jgi:hypothetical protein